MSTTNWCADRDLNPLHLGRNPESNGVQKAIITFRNAAFMGETTPLVSAHWWPRRDSNSHPRGYAPEAYVSAIPPRSLGALDWIRTSTRLPGPAPQAGVSTISPRMHVRKVYSSRVHFVNPRFDSAGCASVGRFTEACRRVVADCLTGSTRGVRPPGCSGGAYGLTPMPAFAATEDLHCRPASTIPSRVRQAGVRVATGFGNAIGLRRPWGPD